MRPLIFYSTAVLLFLRSWVPDSLDLMAKQYAGLPVGSYLVHPVDVLLIIISVPALLRWARGYPRAWWVFILGLLASLVFDVLWNPNIQSSAVRRNVFAAYVKILAPMLGVGTLLCVASPRRLAVLSSIAYFTAGFVGLQHLIQLVFPRETWVHESISLGPFVLYRAISTSGPATAGGYVMLFLLWFSSHFQPLYPARWTAIQRMLQGLFVLAPLTRGVLAMWITGKLFPVPGPDQGRSSTRRRLGAALLGFGVLALVSVSRIGSGYGLSGDILRLDQMRSSYRMAWQSERDLLLGKGFGATYPREVHGYIMRQAGYPELFPVRATHNLHALLLLELGILRLLALYAYLGWTCYLLYGRSRAACGALLLSLIILWNLETILLFSEYNYAMMLFVFAVLRWLPPMAVEQSQREWLPRLTGV